MRLFSWKFLVLLCLVYPRSLAQSPASFTLRRMAAVSGYVFSGTVMNVQRVPVSRPNEVATIAITFRVDEGVRGVRSRQTLTIREWAGLWNGGERYRPGEHVVLMLYAPSAVGLTSPVGGSLGKFPLDQNGNLGAKQREALASDPVVGPWLRGKKVVSGHEFVRVLRRAAKE